MYNFAKYQPDLPKELPKDFTIEFDAIAYGVSKEKTSQTARFTVSLGDGKQPLKEGASYVYTYLPVFQGWAKPIHFGICRNANREVASGRVENDIRQPFLEGCHVAISGKGQRYRLYVDGQKIVDMPRGLPYRQRNKNIAFFYIWFAKRTGAHANYQSPHCRRIAGTPCKTFQHRILCNQFHSF